MSHLTIVVFTKTLTDCRPCKATVRRLVDKVVHFVEVPIDTDDAVDILEDLKTDGFQESPVVKVFDEHDELAEAWSGYRPDRLDYWAAVFHGPIEVAA